MVADASEIKVRRLERPLRRDADEDIYWICQALGLSDEDDDMTSSIFREVLDASLTNRQVGSTKVSKKVEITRGGVVYHLNHMIESGVIVRDGRAYKLRCTTLERTVDEVEEDALRMFRRIKEVAREIDAEFGLFEVDDTYVEQKQRNRKQQKTS